MQGDLSQSDVERLLKGVTIPPRPTLLLEVDQELKRSDPDISRIARLISRDVGISAAILKTMNSPLFGLRSKIGSVSQAVQLLGTRNARNVITGLVLRNAVGGAANLERFWDSAEKVATINAYICSILPKAPREEAYTFGLFRDCGIPLLMQRFESYRETLKFAAGDDRPMTVVEEERHATSHVTVGFMIAHSWGLSEVICQAILHHHDLSIIGAAGNDLPMTQTLVAVNCLAEHLNDSSLRLRQDSQWEQFGGIVLDYLGLTAGEMAEIQEDVVALCV
jgi:HD-like signal output (HDOD) protein